MKFKDIRLDVTTNSGGAGSAEGGAVIGYLAAIEFLDGDLADAHTAVVSFTTNYGNSVTVWSTTAGDTNSDVFKQSLIATVDQANDAVAATYGPNYARPFVAGKPKLTVASGGDTKTGGCILYFEV